MLLQKTLVSKFSQPNILLNTISIVLFSLLIIEEDQDVRVTVDTTSLHSRLSTTPFIKGKKCELR